MTSFRLRPLVFLALLVAGGFVVVLISWQNNFKLASQNVLSPHLPTTVRVPSSSLLESAWQVRQRWDVPSSTRILIAPHHLIASKEIASLFSSLPFKPSKVFLLSPDHFFQGRTTLTTTLATFASPQATSTVDKMIVSRLLERLPELRIGDSLFIKEHGVFALLPFVDKAWPNVSIIPIAVRNDASTETLNLLSQALSNELKQDPPVLLVVSSDFSHYLPAELADFHDERTIVALRALDAEVVPKLEADVPGTLIVGLRVARVLALGDVRIHAHTNSLRIARATISQDSTSHFLASFSEGEIHQPCTYGLQSRLLTTLIFGSLNMSISDPLALLRGQEDRALHGQDELFFLDGSDAAQFSSSLTILSSSSTFSPSMRLRQAKTTPPLLEMHLSKHPTSPQLAIGFVSACENDPTQKNKAYLFPLRFSKDGTSFVLGNDRQKALEAIARRSQPALRGQIRICIVEW